MVNLHTHLLSGNNLMYAVYKKLTPWVQNQAGKIAFTRKSETLSNLLLTAVTIACCNKNKDSLLSFGLKGTQQIIYLLLAMNQHVCSMEASPSIMT